MEFTTRAFSPWHALVKVYEDNCQGVAQVGGDTDYRVTVERIEPEPEKKWWECLWCPVKGLTQLGPTDYPQYTEIAWSIEGKLAGVEVCVQSVDKPTLSEFAAAVKDSTGVEIPIPEEEQPQWWHWFRNDQQWVTGQFNTYSVYLSDTYISVYGTAADRDAKRDALLEAARKAGEPD